MDLADGGMIKMGDPICGEEDDALAVVELVGKHGDKTGPDSIPKLAALEEHICFI